MTKIEQWERVATILEDTIEDTDLRLVVRNALAEVLEPVHKYDVLSHIYKDSKGNITHIKCKLSRVKLPADEKHFRAVNNNGIRITPTLMLSKTSRQAEELKSSHKATKRNIINTIVREKRIPTDEELRLLDRPDYSEVRVLS